MACLIVKTLRVPKSAARDMAASNMCTSHWCAQEDKGNARTELLTVTIFALGSQVRNCSTARNAKVSHYATDKQEMINAIGKKSFFRDGLLCKFAMQAETH